MPVPDALVALLGAILVALGLLDVFFAIFHADRPGPVSRLGSVLLWRLLRAPARVRPGARRELLALAGPLMMATTVLLWAFLLVLGYALLAWPHLGDAYRLDPALGEPTFHDALYFSGVTFTTLGYGDVTPTAPAAQALAVMEAGSGFAVMTAAVTYLLTLFHGLEERNAMALRVLAETGGTGRGVEMLARVLPHEGPEGVRARLEEWTRGLRSMQQKVHRFPILEFHHRTRNPRHDPEPMLQAVAETALRVNLLARVPSMRSLRPAAEHLDDALTQLLDAVAHHHAPRALLDAFHDPRPGDAERALVREAWGDLERLLGAAPAPPDDAEDERVLALAFRIRIVLDDLDRLTGWRSAREAELALREKK